jgi:hypothetical protein
VIRRNRRGFCSSRDELHGVFGGRVFTKKDEAPLDRGPRRVDNVAPDLPFSRRLSWGVRDHHEAEEDCRNGEAPCYLTIIHASDALMPSASQQDIQSQIALKPATNYTP